MTTTRRAQRGGWPSFFSWGRAGNKLAPISAKSLKPLEIRTLGERIAPLRGVLSRNKQLRYIGRNIQSLEGKRGAAEAAQKANGAAKAANNAYDKADAELKDAINRRDTAWKDWTKASADVRQALWDRQKASKGLMDRVRGVFKHGLKSIGTRKSYVENAKADEEVAKRKQKALAQRAVALREAAAAEAKAQEGIIQETKRQEEAARAAINSILARNMLNKGGNNKNRTNDNENVQEGEGEDEEEETSNPNATSGTSNLPQPWEQRTSKTSGKPYYYNPTTQTVQWKKPA